jgi:broad specificity phosphatase PhoE
MSVARVVFLRHAQGTHNAAAAVIGSRAYFDAAYRDATLTAEGVRQAWTVREAGRLGRAEDYDLIFCSPLLRCRQTLLETVPGAERFPVLLDDRLMEPQGTAICNRRAEREDLRGSVPAVWRLDGMNTVNPYDVLEEGGTVGEDGHGGFERRVRSFTGDRIALIPEGARVLVVAHHDWIRAWFRLFEPGRGVVSLGNCEWVTAEL